MSEIFVGVSPGPNGEEETQVPTIPRTTDHDAFYAFASRHMEAFRAFTGVEPEAATVTQIVAWALVAGPEMRTELARMLKPWRFAYYNTEGNVVPVMP